MSLRQGGFSLTELMVSLLLGSVLMAGIIDVFSASKAGYLQQESLARLQENGRMAMDVLTREIRRAGFYGCVSDRAEVRSHLNDPENFFWNILRPVEGFEGSGASWTTGTPGTLPLANQLGGRLVTQSDILNIRYFDPDTRTALDQSMSARDSAVSVSRRSQFESGDIAAVSNCVSAEVFQVTGKSRSGLSHVSGSRHPGNTSASLYQRRKSNTEMAHEVGGGFAYKVINRSYFIATGVSGQPGLYMTSARGGTKSTVEIVEGVEQMQLIYLLDSDLDGVPDMRKQAHLVDFDLENVLLVEVHLLMRAMSQLAAKPDTTEYDLDADGVVDFTGNGDFRLRRTLHTSVATPNLHKLALP